MISKIDERLLKNFKGNFEDIPEINSSQIRIFVSSTFSGKVKFYF